MTKVHRNDILPGDLIITDFNEFWMVLAVEKVHRAVAFLTNSKTKLTFIMQGSHATFSGGIIYVSDPLKCLVSETYHLVAHSKPTE